MTKRELRAVAEAIDFWGYETSSATRKAARAAISASDSKYVKGLVEALKRINIEIEDTVDRYNGTPLQRLQLVKKISYHALQTLPEDLR